MPNLNQHKLHDSFLSHLFTGSTISQTFKETDIDRFAVVIQIHRPIGCPFLQKEFSEGLSVGLQ